MEWKSIILTFCLCNAKTQEKNPHPIFPVTIIQTNIPNVINGWLIAFLSFVSSPREDCWFFVRVIVFIFKCNPAMTGIYNSISSEVIVWVWCGISSFMGRSFVYSYINNCNHRAREEPSRGRRLSPIPPNASHGRTSLWCGAVPSGPRNMAKQVRCVRIPGWTIALLSLWWLYTRLPSLHYCTQCSSDPPYLQWGTFLSSDTVYSLLRSAAYRICTALFCFTFFLPK